MARKTFLVLSAPAFLSMAGLVSAAEPAPLPVPLPLPMVQPGLGAKALGPAVKGPAAERVITPPERLEGAEEDFGEDSASDEPVTGRSIELVQERYPNSALKVERHITEDAAGNLVNHGRWSQWDEQGNLIGSGDYDHGQQQGKWVRYLDGDSGSIFSAAVFKQFQRPFISEANFENGKLDGVWTVVDAKKRRIMETIFKDGQLNGTSTWWYPNGQKLRETRYVDGQIDGEYLEWSVNNQVTVRDVYKSGHRLATQAEWYSAGKKKSEGAWLYARQITQQHVDWWNASMKTEVIGKDGVDQRTGEWVWWHPNGKVKLQGSYLEGLPAGKFIWWYPNNQKMIEGSYTAGKQEGAWTWWHANGLTQYKGEYSSGHQSGRWTGYAEDGKLVEVQDFDNRSIGPATEGTDPADDSEGQTASAPLISIEETAELPVLRR